MSRLKFEKSLMVYLLSLT